MTRTEELMKLCNAVYDPTKDDWELKQALAKFNKAANPKTIKQLVELCRLQHEAIKIMKGRLEFSHAGNKAIAAFNKFERGE